MYNTQDFYSRALSGAMSGEGILPPAALTFVRLQAVTQSHALRAMVVVN